VAGIVSRRTDALALMLVVAYLVTAAVPCRPLAGAAVSGLAHAAADHALRSDVWCASAAGVRFLLPVCPCGCAKRTAALGGRLGTVLVPSVARAPAAPTGEAGVLLAEGPRAPGTPVRAIDHVPLPT
jgi:hypothetical protein